MPGDSDRPRLTEALECSHAPVRKSGLDALSPLTNVTNQCLETKVVAKETRRPAGLIAKGMELPPE